jgi:hypothetical protein
MKDQNLLNVVSPSTSWLPTYTMDDAALNSANNFESYGTMEIDPLNWIGPLTYFITALRTGEKLLTQAIF